MTTETTAPSNPTTDSAHPAVELAGATLAVGGRILWQDLDLAVQPGEFVAILGANGSGKSSLFRVILGQQRLQRGSVSVAGRPAAHGSPRLGYVPQRTAVDPLAPVRVADLVRLGIDGHCWGVGLHRAAVARRRVVELLEAVGLSHLATEPVARLSGGELQRVRIAEALAGGPELLLADEPLAALDPAQAHRVVALLDRQRREHGTAILFVTHDINTVLDSADRVLYLANGGFRLGTPDEVLTSDGLTELYGAPVDVFHTEGRIIVVAAGDPGADLHDPHDPHDPEALPSEVAL